MEIKTKFNCKTCSKEIEDFVSNKRSGFCSLPCYWKSKKGTSGFWLGKTRDKDTIAKISSTKKKGYQTGEVIHPRLGYRKWSVKEYRAIKTRFAHDRRARVRGNGGTYTLTQWESLKEQYKLTCPCCGESEPNIILHVDHITPISKGDTNDISNIQPLCKLCNTRKSNKHSTRYPTDK